MSNIPSIIKEAELSLEKLDGMIDADDHSKLKAAVDELGASFRKRAYGYTLNELYTVATLLKSKRITQEDLVEGLKNHNIDILSKETISMTIDNKIQETDISYAYKYLLDLVMTVRDPEDYKKAREELRGLINHSSMLREKFKELLSTNVMIVAGRTTGKNKYNQLVRELRKELGLSED